MNTGAVEEGTVPPGVYGSSYYTFRLSSLDPCSDELILDVRSPCEYSQGHIPGSMNLPLFSDEERSCVGTIYKKVGHKEAVRVGLDYLAPRMGALGSSLEKLANEHSPNKQLKILCFRGGLRSQSMLFLAKLFRIEASILQGGYKGYRRAVHAIFSLPWKFQVFGGFTGAGKSAYLRSLKGQVLDLEALAQHSGSAFGAQHVMQPTTEMFENLIAQKLATFRLEEPIRVEDESRLIGSCVIPETLFNRMQLGVFKFLHAPLNERIERIVVEYGSKPTTQLLEGVTKLQKRIGREKVKEISALILSEDLHAAVKILIGYYDEAYQKSLQKRGRLSSVCEL
jgi:tRNA 2-selenouridine synthase